MMHKILLILLVIVSPFCMAQSWHAEPGTVALTFDDGPSPYYTPKVLAILREHNIKATFFVMGQFAKKHPELIRAIDRAGHAVALHSMTHPKLTRISASRLQFEVSRPKEIVQSILSKEPQCLRPPFGLSNRNVIEVAKKYNISVVPMGFNSFDYQNKGVERLTKWVVRNAHSGQVILLHDGYKARGQTVAALPGIIAGIKKRGLGFSAFCYPK